MSGANLRVPLRLLRHQSPQGCQRASVDPLELCRKLLARLRSDHVHLTDRCRERLEHARPDVDLQAATPSWRYIERRMHLSCLVACIGTPCRTSALPRDLPSAE
jgi:hypothetical protein